MNEDRDQKLLKDLEFPPRPHVIAIRETVDDGWDRDTVDKAGGSLWLVYLYDASVATYCCEITPSYELRLTEVLPEKYPDEEDLESLYDLMDECYCDAPTYRYFHCFGIDSKPYGRHHKALRPPGEDDLEETYEEYMEGVFEDLRCNGGIEGAVHFTGEKS